MGLMTLTISIQNKRLRKFVAKKTSSSFNKLHDRFKKYIAIKNSKLLYKNFAELKLKGGEARRVIV